jgi:hypothetical protein
VSKRNEYQEFYFGAKAAGAKSLQPYHLHKQIVLKSWSLRLLESSGPLQPCTGIALFLLCIYRTVRARIAASVV